MRKDLRSLMPFPFGRRSLADFFDDFMSDDFSSFFPAMMGREIRVDIHETDNEIVLEAELPGFNKEDIEITLDDNSLTLKANQKMESEIRRDNYLRRERHSGSLVRSFLLPTEVDENQVKTSFNNGLLELRLRQKEPTKTRRRRINID
mgnify:FL=1